MASHCVNNMQPNVCSKSVGLKSPEFPCAMRLWRRVTGNYIAIQLNSLFFKSGVQNKSMPLIVDKYQHVTLFLCLLHMLGSQSLQKQNVCFVSFLTSRVSRKYLQSQVT